MTGRRMGRRRRSDGNAAERELVLQEKAGAQTIIRGSSSHFATQAGAVLTSPYPSVDGLTRGFVRLR
jgi:hypothetical protein